MTTDTDALYALALMSLLFFGVVALLIAAIGGWLRSKVAARVAAVTAGLGILGFFGVAFYAFYIMLGEMW